MNPVVAGTPNVSEWRCTAEEVAAIVAELRPVIDRLAARSVRDLVRWANEDELANRRTA